MTIAFGDSERHILALFKPGERFTHQQSEYCVRISGKPVVAHGEPKTDIYVRAVSSAGEKEFKISFKRENANFLENKISSERASQLFGADWARIIHTATSSIKDAFAEKPLIYKSNYGKTEAGAITLGWKFELLNVKSGHLSGEMPLSHNQLVDVYAGTNLAEEKKDAAVNDIIIHNSGVANYILFESVVPSNIQEAADLLIPISEYADANPHIYFACKALNFRSFRQKYDGNRPLAVYVDWGVCDGRLSSRLIYGDPLQHGGDWACARLLNALRSIGAATTDDLNSSNVADIRLIAF